MRRLDVRNGRKSDDEGEERGKTKQHALFSFCLLLFNAPRASCAPFFVLLCTFSASKREENVAGRARNGGESREKQRDGSEKKGCSGGGWKKKKEDERLAVFFFFLLLFSLQSFARHRRRTLREARGLATWPELSKRERKKRGAVEAEEKKEVKNACLFFVETSERKKKV